MSEKKARKKAERRETKVVVVEVMEDGMLATGPAVASGMVSDGDAWIRQYGADGHVYRVARLYPAVKVSVKNVPKITVEEVK